jgi:hypothetical protein
MDSRIALVSAILQGLQTATRVAAISARCPLPASQPKRVITQAPEGATMKKIAIAGLGLMLSVGAAGTVFAAQQAVTGTLEDSFCFVTMGAHGPDHKKCAIGCAKKGIPVALVEKGTDNMYILLPPKNDTAMPDYVIDKMEDEVTVTGEEYDKGGVKYLTAQSVK